MSGSGYALAVLFAINLMNFLTANCSAGSGRAFGASGRSATRRSGCSVPSSPCSTPSSDCRSGGCRTGPSAGVSWQVACSSGAS